MSGTPPVPGGSEPSPAVEPPPGYRLLHYFVLTERRSLIWMNIIGTLFFVITLAAVFTYLSLYERIGAPLTVTTLPASLPVWVYALLIAFTLALHEGLHGLAMLTVGVRPHFGIKPRLLVLYTTSNAIFTRQQYLYVTLAPLLGISLLGLAVMPFLPVALAAWAGMMVALNAASSIGDLWMTAVMTSFPADARFRDEADGMTIFMPEA